MTFIPPAGYPLSTYTPPDDGALPGPFSVLADRIDPATGDIVSFMVGDDPTDAALQWQFTVRQGSGAALGTNGNRLHAVTKATPQAPVQLEDEARRVCEKFVTRGDLRNVSVEAEVIGGNTATGAVELRRTNPHTNSAGARTFGGA